MASACALPTTPVVQGISRQVAATLTLLTTTGGPQEVTSVPKNAVTTTRMQGRRERLVAVLAPARSTATSSAVRDDGRARRAIPTVLVPFRD